MTAETKIRPMRDEEKPAVRDIMRRSFPLVQRWFFSFTPHVLVAETGGKIQGAVVLKLFALPRGRRGGLMYWAFTRPDTRGQGVGRQLFDAGLRFLEEQGCDEILGCVEGNNTSSSTCCRRAASRSCRRAGSFAVGGCTPLVWLKIFHYIDIGYRGRALASAWADSAPLQWWASNLAMNSLLLLVVFWRLTGADFFRSPLLGDPPGARRACRELAMRLAAPGGAESPCAIVPGVGNAAGPGAGSGSGLGGFPADSSIRLSRGLAGATGTPSGSCTAAVAGGPALLLLSWAWERCCGARRLSCRWYRLASSSRRPCSALALRPASASSPCRFSCSSGTSMAAGSGTGTARRGSSWPPSPWPGCSCEIAGISRSATSADLCPIHP